MECKRRNELRDYERVFANDRRSFRNGITNTKRYPQAQHKNTAHTDPLLSVIFCLSINAHKKKRQIPRRIPACCNFGLCCQMSLSRMPPDQLTVNITRRLMVGTTGKPHTAVDAGYRQVVCVRIWIRRVIRNWTQRTPNCRRRRCRRSGIHRRMRYTLITCHRTTIPIRICMGSIETTRIP